MAAAAAAVGRRRSRTGLRLQISATIAGIVLVAVAGLGLAVHLVVTQNRVAEVRASADERMHAALDIYRSTGLLSFDARLDDPAVPSALVVSLTGDGARGTLVSGGSVRDLWAAGRTGGKIISIHLRFEPVDESVRALDRALVVAGTATVTAASLIGALSANRIARRLRLAARAARQVAADDGGSAPDPARSVRHAVGRGHDEVGDFADAVDAMTARLAARLESEQRLTADVAHDLRTPVTGLITAAALLDSSRPAELVRDRAAALAALVEELLEVARLDAGVETAELEHVRLADLAARAVSRGVAKGEFPPGSVTIPPPPASQDEELSLVTVLTDPRRLERILSNLIRNALHHGRPPVEVVVAGTRISVTDRGPGFSPELLRHGPQRFHRSGPGGGGRTGGHGVGLVIAAGQARVIGAEMVLTNRDGGGARASIELPTETWL